MVKMILGHQITQILIIAMSFRVTAAAAASPKHRHVQHNQQQRHVGAVPVEQHEKQQQQFQQIGAVPAEQQQKQHQQQFFFDIDGPMLDGQQRQHNLRQLMVMMMEQQQRRRHHGHGLPKHRRETELVDLEPQMADGNDLIGSRSTSKSPVDGNNELLLINNNIDPARSAADNGNKLLDAAVTRDSSSSSRSWHISSAQSDAVYDGDESGQRVEHVQHTDATIGEQLTALLEENMEQQQNQQQQQQMNQSFLLLVASCAVLFSLALSMAGFALFYYVSIIHRGGFACWATTTTTATDAVAAAATDYDDGTPTTTTTIMAAGTTLGNNRASRNSGGGGHPQFYNYSMSCSTTVMTLADEAGEEGTVAMTATDGSGDTVAARAVTTVVRHHCAPLRSGSEKD